MAGRSPWTETRGVAALFKAVSTLQMGGLPKSLVYFPSEADQLDRLFLEHLLGSRRYAKHALLYSVLMRIL